MIGQAVKHGRSMKDARNLSAHLLKDDDAKIELLNSAASSLDEVMSDMMIARDGSRAKDAFLHLSISPARDMSHDELRQVAGIVARHFGGEENQAALVFHEKDRANGKGNRHAHLVLGKVSPEGDVIPAGFEKIRMETAMRIAEFEMGEPATLGRHHTSSIKWLRENGRQDVAQWLDLAHGSNPEKPKSPASPAKRQMIQRAAGTDLATVTTTVRDAWARSDNPQAFAAALAEGGFEIQQGQKDGVFLVVKDGVQVGALDRLLKEKRRDVAQRMEGFNHVASSSEKVITTSASHEKPCRSGLSEGRRVAAAPAIVGTAGADRRRSNSPDSGRARTDHNRPEASNDVLERPGRKSGRFDEIKAARQIESHSSGWDRLRELRDDFVQFIRNYITAEKETPVFSDRDRMIADVFSKACHFSAENMERLERLDPELSAFREQCGERCRGMSQDQILENLDAWRERGAELTSNFDQDDNDYHPPSMRI